MDESNTGSEPVESNGGPLPRQDATAPLVARIAGGDAEALSVLYDETSRYVHSIALRILRDADEAEEITLDVYQQVWRLAASYDPARCRVNSWLGMMTRSRALDRWRSMRARQRILVLDLPEKMDLESAGESPESGVVRNQEQARIRTALARLPDEQRMMIEMAFWEGQSHSEIAERTGVPLGTVKTRIRLGMLKLREALADDA